MIYLRSFLLAGVLFLVSLAARAQDEPLSLVSPFILYDFNAGDGPSLFPPGLQATALTPQCLTRVLDPKYNLPGDPSYNTRGHGKKLELDRYSHLTLRPEARHALSLSYVEVKLSIAKPDELQEELSLQIRSSLDNFALPVATITVENSGGTAEFRIILPLPPSFSKITVPVEFRFYVYRINDTGTVVRIDDLVLSGQAQPLPVTLRSFEGRESGPLTVLEWTTASEQGNSHFEVLRSTDGEAFKQVGRVGGVGTSNRLEYYAFSLTDTAPLAYFRLRQVDYNGTVAYSPVVAVQKYLPLHPLPFIYPVPSGPDLTTLAAEQGLVLQVYALTGQHRGTFPLQQGVNLVRSNLRSGQYLGVLEKNNRPLYHQRFIVSSRRP
jgi:hypothetical protein